MFTTDGSTGLRAALQVVFPRIPVQLCWAHKVRNIADQMPQKDWFVRGRSLDLLPRPEQERSPAERAFRDWKQPWESRRPKAVACVDRDLDALLNLLEVPEAHWKRVQTANVIERPFQEVRTRTHPWKVRTANVIVRPFREVRRRTRPMSSFSNPASCDRIVFGAISHLNRSWETKPLPEFKQSA